MPPPGRPDTHPMDETPSTWHMTLVYFGFRNDGPLPTDGDRNAMRLRRLVAVGLLVMLVVLAAAAWLGS
jgi:hypothetical protein